MSIHEWTEAELTANTVALPRLPAQELDARALAVAVALRYGLSLEELLGPSRRRPAPAARAQLYRALRAHGWSLTRIAAFAGGRDHTTVMSALNGLNRKGIVDERA